MTNDLEKFIKKYFAKIDQYILNHKKILEKFKDTDINYLILKPILIDQAVSFLNSVDQRFPKKELKKTINELNEIYDFYKELVKKSQMLETVFYESYLYQNPEYQTLYKELEAVNNHIKYLNNAIKKIDLSKNDKHSKTMYVNMITQLDKAREKKQKLHKKLTKIEKEKKDEFLKIFPKKLNKYIEVIEHVLNIMIMVLSKVIWVKARESSIINNFFNQINKQLSLKAFINDYLKKNLLRNKPDVRDELKKLIEN